MDFDEVFCDLDPDVFCLRHGKEKPMGPYGVRYGGCDECEPEPDTFDEALATKFEEQG